jgi:hypothetical protein
VEHPTFSSDGFLQEKLCRGSRKDNSTQVEIGNVDR